jgi:hypothetical protein
VENFFCPKFKWADEKRVFITSLAIMSIRKIRACLRQGPKSLKPKSRNFSLSKNGRKYERETEESYPLQGLGAI